jgi:hypothetical protein
MLMKKYWQHFRKILMKKYFAPFLSHPTLFESPSLNLGNWDSGTRGRVCSPSVRGRHSGKSVFKKSIFSTTFRPQVSLFPECCTRGRGPSRGPLFPECHGLYDTRGGLSSLSAILPRVQHSGKSFFRPSAWYSALGEFSFSHSAYETIKS